ncbi:MAG: tetratricopeptide repeat protein [Myxococcales bacterium]|nr:tetratricopeptide repeat protein [Myxococcales bacterium]
MAVELEPLLQKLSGLAPLFGRARDDLDAMVSRGRAGDFKGVMQNARLVLEAVLRSLVTEELKQTPGKAMLDELVTKFRQQANAGIIPTNVLAHMGTVQAWGNLSSHDHAGSLADAPVQVGQEEAVASLNSMAAILTWYANKRGLAATPAAGSAPAVATPFQGAAVIARKEGAPPPAKSKLPLVGAGVGLLAIAGVVAVVSLRPSGSGTGTGPGKTEQPFTALDALYGSWKEPVPPPSCRRAEEAERLAQNVRNVNALRLIDSPSPEAAYLLARATFEDLKQKSPALDAALACPGFANAQYLAGKIAIAEGRLDDALASLKSATTQAPKFLDARASLAGIMLQQQEVDAALAEAEKLISADPDYAAGYLLRFSGRVLKGDRDAAMKDLCTAVNKGSATARQKLESINGSCEGVAP